MSNPPISIAQSRTGFRVCAVALVAAFLLVGPATTATAQRKPWSGSSIVRDPEWQARFLGSYGFLSGAEPESRNNRQPSPTTRTTGKLPPTER